MIGKYAVRSAALGYLAVLLALPVGYVFWHSFDKVTEPSRPGRQP